MTPLLAAVNWLNISIDLLLVIHVIICLLLALVVLMQRPKQEGLGAAFGSGLTDQAFGARTTDVLQKGTVYLGTLFFIITLVLAILIGKRQKIDPIISDDAPEKVEKPSPEAPVTLPAETNKEAQTKKGSEIAKEAQTPAVVMPKAEKTPAKPAAETTTPSPAPTPKTEDKP